MGRRSQIPLANPMKIRQIGVCCGSTMSELSQQNPLGRFSRLAETYAKHRPSYPAAVIDFIIEKCALGPRSVLADIGSGTGISSRLFGARGIPVVGVEPNAEMRQQASAEPVSADSARIDYCGGAAEATGFADRSVDAVVAAQAFHWFQADVAFAEFRRILKPSGWLILMWNERDETDPFTAAYGDVIRTAPDTAAVEAPRAKAGEALRTSALFHRYERVLFRNQQIVDESGMLGRAFSASYAPKDPVAAAAFAEALRHVFAQFQRDGHVALQYITSVYLAQRM
jgi:SAM-dependent methyltransferase